jgi:hypothetical protein
MRRSMMAMGMSALLAACSHGGAVDTAGTLDMNPTQSGVEGSYSSGESSLRFSSHEVEPGVVDVVVSLHGLDLTAVVNSQQNVAEVDGFATGGTDTQLVAQDRDVLKDFVKALEAEGGSEGSLAATTLYRVSSNWSQTPDTVPLARSVVGSENRSWVSICGYFGSYVDATHDDNNFSAFSPYSTSHAHVGYRSASTFYYIGFWTTTVQDHNPLLYEYGNCYGNCGGGCPSSAQTLTLDCHDHDQCVRNGHAIASLYCDDEFTSASDDEFFAPTCSGT